MVNLLVSYRRRYDNLLTLFEWFRHKDKKKFFLTVIEQDSHPTLSMEEGLKAPNINYCFFENSSVFNISKSLNLGLAKNNQKLVCPFDIDLIPYRDTLEKQLFFASKNLSLTISGFRLLSEYPIITKKNIESAFKLSQLSTTESEQDILTRIKSKENYGVIPFLDAKRLEMINGWDESFIGWGGEDQELLDRYLGDEKLLVRSENLIYLHQAHKAESNWREDEFTKRNRLKYSKRKGW